MPIKNREDAVEVEERIGRIFDAAPVQRVAAVRGMFVEVLDFNDASGQVSLAGATGNVHLPEAAERVAEMDGVDVLFIAMPPSNTERVRKAEVDAAAKLLASQLKDDLLLVFTNPSASQLHIILPSFAGSRPTLRRMVVDRDLLGRTAIQQVSNIYWNYQASGSIFTALDQAFDVEPVTREFFGEYKRLFDAAETSVAGFQETDEGREERRSFVQTLFNRLMFVYFLSRKGWLTFKGDADYLNALWHDYGSLAGDHNFYTARLETLFFAGLNNPQSLDVNKDNEATLPVIGTVPFLNGGLFERTALDQRDGITVPDSAIHRILTGLFDRFNFTVMESTPFDIEVAVDPEMLGKVFEELVTGRHDSGAYYTPRPVVSFMCREALKGYLEGQDTGLTLESIAKFVDAHETESIQVAQARRLADALAQVTVVDPACGSGAYLLGMMQELIELQTTLYNAGADSKSLYDLKLEIIQRNLYGVDIDDFAVNVAMLRLWLSLAIDYEGEKPEPLPNLDFKVVCGDSLLAPDPSAGVEVQGTLGQDMEQFRRLGQLKAEYIRASLGSQKERLKRQIETLTGEIREALGVSAIDGVVDWRVDLGEIFVERKGFDIAIANPPYVRQELIGSGKAVLTRQYADAVVARSDLYCYFYARALHLLRDGGMHVFVCSNSWLDVGYGAKLQEYLLNNARIHAIYESAVERQFSTADINTIISVIGKTSVPVDCDTRFVSLRADFETALANAGQRREILKNRTALRTGGMHGNKYAGDKWGGKYLRAPDIYHHILEQCADKLVRLGDVATVRRGITTGANDFFFLTQECIAKFGIEPEYCRPVMTSPQESRSIAVDPDKLPMRLFMCHQDKEALADAAALDYIRWGEAQGYHARTSVKSRRRWYDLGGTPMAHVLMNKMIDTTSRAFLTEDGLYANNVLYEISYPKSSPIKVCAALNSTVCQLITNLEGRVNFGGGMLELAAYEISSLQIANPQLLPELDPTVFDSPDWDVLSPSAERWQIDGMVFDALGLTAGERLAVYEGVAELVGNRKQRASSIAEAPRTVESTGADSDTVSRNIAARGKTIYAEKVLPQVDEGTDQGKYAVVDVFSEDYEIDPHISAGVWRLVARHPGAVTYKVRIGHPSVYKMDRPRKRVR